LVVALPIVFSIVGGDTIPYVDHLKYEDWWDKEYPKEWWQGKKYSGKSIEMRYN
jgi:hypothetical protein